MGVRDVRSDLLVENPLRQRATRLIAGRRRPALGAALIVVVVAAVWWGPDGFRVLRGACFSMSGEALAVGSTTKSIGVVREGDQPSVQFRITNRGHHPVRIVGCMTYCNCIVPDDLPITLRAGELREFKVSVRANMRKLGSSSESINQPVTLFTTSSGQAEIGLVLHGEVRSAAISEGSGS